MTGPTVPLDTYLRVVRDWAAVCEAVGLQGDESADEVIAAFRAEAAAGPREHCPTCLYADTDRTYCDAEAAGPRTEYDKAIAREYPVAGDEVGALLAETEAREHAAYIRMRAEAAAGPRDELPPIGRNSLLGKSLTDEEFAAIAGLRRRWPCAHSWDTDADICPECGADWSGVR